MLDKIHRGYIEGYYGKLLSFEDRHKLLACLQGLSMDSYLYAPKDDLCHRFDWRRPYVLRAGVLISPLFVQMQKHDKFMFWPELPPGLISILQKMRLILLPC